MMKPEKLDLVSEWDKTFPKSKSVNHKKVTFVNRYGITLAADMYTPKNEQKKFPALAVCGPFGAVKGQCYDGKKVLIISTSLRGKSNSEILAKKSVKGAHGMPGRLCSMQRPCSRHTTLGGMCKR